MLKGGAIIFYLERVAEDPKNAVFLVGYQIPGTPGHQLLTERKFLIRGEEREVKAKIQRFDFSSHAGRSGLMELIKMVRGNPTVFTVHGANGNCEMFAKTIKEEVGLRAIAPRPGEVYDI
jgi:putative mRNA 3-end processing factor